MSVSVALFLGVLLLFGAVPIVHAATSGATGYVAYDVHATTADGQKAASVNESVTASSTGGESILLLAVKSALTNFTYSHLINSSAEVFPYMPAIANRSFSYSNDSYSISAKITQVASSQVSFQGSSYTMSNYAISANFTGPKGSGSAQGTISAFPSTLVYSLSLTLDSPQGNGSVSAVLTSTSLSLQAGGAASPAVQTASAGVGLSLAAGALALSLGVRARRANRSNPGPKPDHWVD